MVKVVFWNVVVVWCLFLMFFYAVPSTFEMDTALQQMKGTGLTQSLYVLSAKNLMSAGVSVFLILAGVAMYAKEIGKKVKGWFKVAAVVALVCCMQGCFWRGYEPQKLEVIHTNEEAFLLPFTEDGQKQTSSNNEEYLEKNLVYTQQIRLPQRWLQTGYMPGSGEWRDAAMLLRVDKSPVTREWTADPATGTSNKNEAIWVMTADQVEFSTGWTCTARILSKDDAVKFLHNYPNGTLEKVLDTEVRAKIQTEFGMEVTDLPMDELRTRATPHLQKVINTTEQFFVGRGITITNLGITGGFIYKNATISEKLVEVFNAEQAKNIAIAATQAQSEKNKTIQLEADAKAKALLTEREAEAKGIKAVADAKFYEIEKAKQDLSFYMKLKEIELSKAKVEKWDGKFPHYFMSNGTSPDVLLQMPVVKE